jgi:nicotinate-nucleotide--dimethylbenzimidazole phosphoribosyltransferase
VSTFAGFDAVLLDVGATLVAEEAPATAVAALEARPLPGVIDAVAGLVASGVALGLVTNTATMGEREVRGLLAPVGLDSPFTVVVTSAELGIAKPRPEPLLAAAERLGVAPGRCLYVGDREDDRIAADAAGMAFCATDDGLATALARADARSRSGPFVEAAGRVAPLDDVAAEQARARHASLAKPAGSLGALEDLGARLAAIAGACPPPAPTPAAVAVFAGDHGVVASGVTPWPSSVTAAMVRTMARGKASINALAAQVGATVTVVDVGVADDLGAVDGVCHANVAHGTADLSLGPAMTVEQAVAALDSGAEVAADLVAGGARLLVTGDMGIGNTTPSAALIGALSGRSAGEVVGRGTGVDDETLALKQEIVAGALARTAGWLDPLAVLASVGGLELAALAGFCIGGAAAGVPVVVDGVIALAGLLTAERLVPGVADRCIAGHRSTEPGASVALEVLGLDPVLDLGLRLGEGSGACLAVPIVQAAARLLSEVATIDEALDPG